MSLGLAEWGSKFHPSFTFYTLPTRIWELLAGSILAYFYVMKGKKKINKNDSIFVFLGLLLIICSIFFFNDKILHPSLITLIPVFGSCLIIWFSNKNEAVTKIFSFNIFIRIGLISYSLYLWHFPILAFTKILEIKQNNFIYTLFLIFITFALSIFTYYFVEKPFRKKKTSKKVLAIIPFTLICIFSASLLIMINNGYSNRFPDILNNNYLKIEKLIKENYKKDINGKEVIFYEKENNININLVGDSHAKNLAYSLLQNIDKDKFNFSTSVYDGCQFILDSNRVNKKTGKKTTPAKPKEKKITWAEFKAKQQLEKNQ